MGTLRIYEDASRNKCNLSPGQLESINYVQKLVCKYQLSLSLQPGGLRYVNNFAILHARDAFVDTPTQTRHLVRLWLDNDFLAWKLPQHLERGNRKVFYDDSGVGRWEIQPPLQLGFKVSDLYTP